MVIDHLSTLITTVDEPVKTMTNAKTSEPPSIATVVLAFSRLELLKRLIDALKNQSRKVDEIIVVFQGNSSEISNWLHAQTDITLVVQENKGSAGGFSRGIQESITRGHVWTWIFDDDAVPDLMALEHLVGSPYFLQDETTFMASRVVDKDRNSYMSPVPMDANLWYGTVLDDKCVRITVACWLGVLVKSDAVITFGLPIEEFFIGEEDLEFTERLARAGKAYCSIPSIITHFQNPKFDLKGKDFLKHGYYLRNSIARIKVQPGSVINRTLRILIQLSKNILLVLQGKSTVRGIPWILDGALMFWPKIKYPTSSMPPETVSKTIN